MAAGVCQTLALGSVGSASVDNKSAPKEIKNVPLRSLNFSHLIDPGVFK